MCISETSLVAVSCCAITAIASVLTTGLSLRNRAKEKYKIKQDAILRALHFLNAYYSYLDYPRRGIVPQRDKSYDSTKMTLEGRKCYENLCVSVDNNEILETFLSIVLGTSDDTVKSLNTFRNLSRKELGLKEVQYSKDSVFLLVISTRALQEKEKKENKI